MQTANEGRPAPAPPRDGAIREPAYEPPQLVADDARYSMETRLIRTLLHAFGNPPIGVHTLERRPHRAARLGAGRHAAHLGPPHSPAPVHRSGPAVRRAVQRRQDRRGRQHPAHDRGVVHRRRASRRSRSRSGAASRSGAIVVRAIRSRARARTFITITTSATSSTRCGSARRWRTPVRTFRLRRRRSTRRRSRRWITSVARSA